MKSELDINMLILNIFLLICYSQLLWILQDTEKYAPSSLLWIRFSDFAISMTKSCIKYITSMTLHAHLTCTMAQRLIHHDVIVTWLFFLQSSKDMLPYCCDCCLYLAHEPIYQSDRWPQSEQVHWHPDFQCHYVGIQGQCTGMTCPLCCLSWNCLGDPMFMTSTLLSVLLESFAWMTKTLHHCWYLMWLGRFSLAVLAQVLEYIHPCWLDQRTESMFLSWSHDTMACCWYFILSCLLEWLTCARIYYRRNVVCSMYICKLYWNTMSLYGCHDSKSLNPLLMHRTNV